jgi:hypothetical protein
MNQSPLYVGSHLPCDPPLPAAIGGALPSIPQLWERAKVMFARVITHIGSTADFSKRWRLTRIQKKEVLGWLEPVEKLARSCLLVRAFNFLMMTPQGQKLLRETPKIEMPKPPAPQPAPTHKTTIPMPGWHTIAQNQRALAEQQKIEQQRAAEQAAVDRHDPGNWGGGFRVVGWRMPEPEDGQRAVPCGFQKQRLPWVEMVEPNPWLAHGSVEKKPPREKDEPALVLARRIEALGRVINNPAPVAMRLARFIAKLPKEALEDLREQYTFARPHWFQGRAFDIPHAAAHARRAATIFCIDSS